MNHGFGYVGIICSWKDITSAPEKTNVDGIALREANYVRKLGFNRSGKVEDGVSSVVLARCDYFPFTDYGWWKLTILSRLGIKANPQELHTLVRSQRAHACPSTARRRLSETEPPQTSTRSTGAVDGPATARHFHAAYGIACHVNPCIELQAGWRPVWLA